jgi:hypothetical protein
MVPKVVEMVELEAHGDIWPLSYLKQPLNEAFHLILKFLHSKWKNFTSTRSIPTGSLDQHSSGSHISENARFMSTGIIICVTVYFISYYVKTTMNIPHNMY